MNTGKGSSSTAVAPATYSFGENPEQAMSSQAMALVALSHTTVEHQLYSVMLEEIATVGTRNSCHLHFGVGNSTADKDLDGNAEPHSKLLIACRFSALIGLAVRAGR